MVLLEILQLTNSQRSFEFNDILYGFAGISAGAIISYAATRLLGVAIFTPLVVTLSIFVAAFLVYFSSKPNHIQALACEIQQPSDSDWTSVLITDFSHQDGFLPNNKMGFCVAQSDIVNSNDIVYSAPLRLTLNGLAAEVREQNSFTIGVQFTSTSIRSFSEIASITWHGTANRYFARINRSGKHLLAMLQFNGGERTSTSIANGVTTDELQELVIQYDGKHQTTWLNGEITGTEIGVLNPPKKINTELVLNIQQTSDHKWWVPFEGELKAIYLGTTVLQEADLQSIFSN